MSTSAVRVHRAAITGLLIVFAAFAVRLLVTGIQNHLAYGRYLQHHCATARLPLCGALLNQMSGGDWMLWDRWTGVAVFPVLVGAFVGAPLAAREFETRSFRFSAAQGVSVQRQLAGKLMALGALVVAAGAVLGLLTTWVLAPDTGASTWDASYFNVTALMLAAWALLYFCLGVLAGSTIRRVVPAMAVTLAATVIGGSLGSGLITSTATGYWTPPNSLYRDMLTVAPAATAEDQALIWFRGDFKAVTLSGHITGSDPSAPVYRSLSCPNYWPGPHDSVQLTCWLSQGGRRLSGPAAQALLNRIPKAVLYRTGDRVWLDAHHVRYWIAYQPGSRYWLFQGIFAAMLLALAVAAGVAAVWLAGRPR